MGERRERGGRREHIDVNATRTRNRRTPPIESESAQVSVEHKVWLAIAGEDHGPDRHMVKVGGPNSPVLGADEASTAIEPLRSQPPVQVPGQERHGLHRGIGDRVAI